MSHFPRNRFLGGAMAFVVVAGLVGSSFYFGFEEGYAKRPNITVSDADNLLKQDFSLFWEAVDVVKEKYVHADDLDDQHLFYGAIRGMIGALDDPYSGFYEPSDAKKFEQDLKGQFGGIGAEIGIRNNQLVVISPLKGNPAERAGLKAGDKIFGINGTSTADIILDEAVKTIRGEVGTDVTLSIMREGWKAAKDFTITRAVIIIPTLDWEMKEGNIAYVQLYNFNANAESLFRQAAFNALLQGAQGMVLDVRNNPGGFLDVAVNLSGWFLKRGEIVVMEKFRSGDKKYFRAQGNSAWAEVPVVILINNGSASASEILAGALRDNRGVQLIGEKSYGKGSVQEVEDLKDGSTMKITIAAWLTPKGHEIEKKGLEPDVEVKLTEKDIEEKRDPQFEKAVSVLQDEIRVRLAEGSIMPGVSIIRVE